MDQESTKTREHSSGVSVETAFWLVPKTNFRAAASCAADIQVPAALAAYQASPAVIEDQSMIGCQLDFDNYFVIDQACPRSLLGVGVSKIVLEVKAVYRVKWKVAVPQDEVARDEDTVNVCVSTASTVPSSGSGEVHLHAAASGAENTTSLVPSPTKKARVLERSRSDPKLITRELLDIMKTAADTGAFYSTDPNDNKTVEFWARWTVRGAKNSAKKDAAAGTGAGIVEKPMILTLFGKFLCKLLVDHDSYEALPKIVGCFKDLATLGVEVPAAGKFLEELARFDIAGDNEFSQDGLTLADITTLFSSNLYLHYRRRRLLARFDQAHAAEGAARQKLLFELCSAKDLPQTIADTVHRARTLWNLDLPEGQRLSFALESKENAAVAAQWAPGEAIGSLLPFVDMQSKVEGKYDDFAATCAVLNRNGLCEQITNPVVKQVHLLLAAMQETTVEAAAAGADASGRLRAVLLEVAKCRLGAAFTDEATLDST